jgi:hypothetical protein
MLEYKGRVRGYSHCHTSSKVLTAALALVLKRNHPKRRKKNWLEQSLTCLNSVQGTQLSSFGDIRVGEREMPGFRSRTSA